MKSRLASRVGTWPGSSISSRHCVSVVVWCEGTTPTATAFKSKAYDDLDVAVQESKTLEKP